VRISYPGGWFVDWVDRPPEADEQNVLILFPAHGQNVQCGITGHLAHEESSHRTVGVVVYPSGKENLGAGLCLNDELGGVLDRDVPTNLCAICLGSAVLNCWVHRHSAEARKNIRSIIYLAHGESVRATVERIDSVRLCGVSWVSRRIMSDWKAEEKASTLREWDERHTSRMHGFTDVDALYRALVMQADPLIPTIFVNATDDSLCPPFRDVVTGELVRFIETGSGGHLGWDPKFISSLVREAFH
jgi:hypothetical protein